MKTIKRKEIYAVAAVYIVLCLLKIVFVFRFYDGPVYFPDEVQYKEYALQWYIDGRQDGVHYPMLYPISIMPAFLFENWYRAMQVLNVLYSSTVIVFTYMIGRLFLDEKKSGYLMLISAALPYHFVYAGLILSENLYFPLLLLCMFLVLKDSGSVKIDCILDILLGFFLAALSLTRYITLVILPVFAVLGIVRAAASKHWGKWKAVRLFLSSVTFFAAYLPWILLNIKDTRLKYILGFGITSTVFYPQMTQKRLVESAVLYAVYLVFLAAPLFPYLLKSVRFFRIRKAAQIYERLCLLVYGITGAFFVAVTRHSYRATYNYPFYERIMGRYLVYISLLFLFLAYAVREKEDVLQKEAGTKKEPVWRSCIVSIASYGALVFAYAVQIKGAVYAIGTEYFTWVNGIEGFKIANLGNVFLVGMFILYIVYILMDCRKDKWGRKRTDILFMGILVFFQLWGMGGCHDSMKEYMEEKGYRTLNTLNGLIAETDLDGETVLYYDCAGGAGAGVFEQYLLFWGNGEAANLVRTEATLGGMGRYYVISDEKTVEKYRPYLVKNYGTVKEGRIERTLLLVEMQE